MSRRAPARAPRVPRVPRALARAGALALALAGIARPAAAQARSKEMWSELDYYRTITPDHYRFYGFVSTTRDEESRAGNWTLGLNLDFLALGADHHGFRTTTIRVGYWRVAALNDGDYHEHRATGEGTVLRSLGRVELQNRARVEARWIAGESYSTRLRDRFRAGWDIPLAGARRVTPYGSVEWYWDSRFHAVVRDRWAFGSIVRFSSRTSIDVSLGRQHEREPDERYVDVLAITLMLYH